MKKFFTSLSFFLALFFLPITGVFAQAAEESSSLGTMGIALGAALAIGLGAMGGALGQGKAASAALEGIARNPGASGKIFVPMIISLALIESLAIYALLIAFFLYGQL